MSRRAAPRPPRLVLLRRSTARHPLALLPLFSRCPTRLVCPMRLSPRFPRRGLFLGAPAHSRRMSWDVRARNLFNAVNAEGASDPNSKVLRANGLNSLPPVLVRMDNASPASQSVAPPLGDREMAAVDRTFQDIGKRLNTAQPLRLQRVAATIVLPASLVAVQPYGRHRPERSTLLRAPPEPCSTQQRIHHARIQFRAFL